MADDIHFTDVGSGRVGYQVHGTGDIDFLMLSGLVGHLDVMWEEPRYRRYIEAIGRYGRVIRFDRRGTGVSDPMPTTGDEIWELWVEDLIGVLDAAGSQQAVLVASNDAGPTGVLFAATHPDRVRALVLFNTTARFLEDEGYPEGHPLEVAELILEHIRTTWGTEAATDYLSPNLAADESFRRWYARFQRASGSPAVAAANLDRILRIDGRGVLGEVRSPTLVLHREHYAVAGPDHARYLARSIPNAVLELVPGTDSPIMTQGMQGIVDRIGAFLGRTPSAPDRTRRFSTVLFTDIVESTQRAVSLGDTQWDALLDAHDTTALDTVGEHNGRFIKTTGDGVLATFDAPTKALQCAGEFQRRARSLGIDVRAGLHAGPVVLRGDGDISGIAVNIAARVLGVAEAGEVLVSRSIPDLLVGDTFRFAARGWHDLKGIPEPVELFEAVAAP